MRRSLVAANWKMNGSREFAEAFFKALDLKGANGDVVFCPPFPYLPLVGELVESSGYDNAGLGAQNVSEQEAGAFTGEVSVAMLKDLAVRYVIVGHSERRSLYHEDSALVATKFRAAREAGLVPILCVGETLEEREASQALDVIGAQLDAVSELVGSDCWNGAVIAYEPVWAIGTGKTATPEEAQAVHEFIRSRLGAAGPQVQILYGGSVKAANAASLFEQPDIDGALVGGASLDAAEFAEICRAA
ncbi:triose-phosphate isomerase [Microbulbifer flavimaris]|uniref:Triosephosphate isomerase n=1 Tax=Microbulbifer flavimaris TaxID=1781068 RepID=A0ABX4HXA3_9GAMM|nr:MULTISPECIES: triose-phosphate isomerase [Microbulbifer]KUJ82524.1 triose-phosphate isomerase [Microbulbifer sp. ZGT114]PCO04734.1 triose-phosphate isomerase [Microbulbifer flavimaris]